MKKKSLVLDASYLFVNQTASEQNEEWPPTNQTPKKTAELEQKTFTSVFLPRHITEDRTSAAMSAPVLPVLSCGEKEAGRCLWTSWALKTSEYQHTSSTPHCSSNAVEQHRLPASFTIPDWSGKGTSWTFLHLLHLPLTHGHCFVLQGGFHSSPPMNSKSYKTRRRGSQGTNPGNNSSADVSVVSNKCCSWFYSYKQDDMQRNLSAEGLYSKNIYQKYLQIFSHYSF